MSVTANRDVEIETLGFDATDGAMTFTLPVATDEANIGRILILKKTDSSTNAVTISGTIDGIASRKLTQQYEFIQIQSDGTTWGVVNSGIAAKAVGTANTGVTVKETSFGGIHQTVLTFTDLAVGSATGAANLAFGKLLYTLPASPAIQTIIGTHLDVALTGTVTIVGDTPDVGLGTTIGSGAVAVLGGTAAFENIVTGQTSGAISGSNSVQTSLNTPLQVLAAANKTIYLNVADGWAGTGDVTATGTVSILWTSIV